MIISGSCIFKSVYFIELLENENILHIHNYYKNGSERDNQPSWEKVFSSENTFKQDNEFLNSK